MGCALVGGDAASSQGSARTMINTHLAMSSASLRASATRLATRGPPPITSSTAESPQRLVATASAARVRSCVRGRHAGGLGAPSGTMSRPHNATLVRGVAESACGVAHLPGCGAQTSADGGDGCGRVVTANGTPASARVASEQQSVHGFKLALNARQSPTHARTCMPCPAPLCPRCERPIPAQRGIPRGAWRR